mmetsp:Transcript_13833/g.15526  ORF Transcript_13833/g.15526 Transcript_13833/m.15526 type:complete len:481 (-) Transcript_13833:186-1628(-)
MSTPATATAATATTATTKVSAMEKFKNMGLQLKEKAQIYMDANPERVEEMKAQAFETLRKKIEDEVDKEEAMKLALEADGKTLPKGEQFKAKAVGVLQPQIVKLADQQQQVVAEQTAAATVASDAGFVDPEAKVAREKKSEALPAALSTAQNLVSKGAASTYRLASGYEMPVMAYGTFRSSPGEVYTCVLEAIKAGYRHFDCAHIYGNEQEIGKAFHHAFSEGMVTREDLFITGKLWNSDHEVSMVAPALQHSLANLQLDYFDLYLIHFPVAWTHTGLDTPGWGSSQLGHTPLIDTWRELERCVTLKKARSIGVSNYPLLLIHDLVTQARIPVSCNQIETHVYYTRDSLVKYCLSRHICVTAHSPLGGGKANEEEFTQTTSPLEDPVVVAIATAHNMTPAQVCLRFLLQRGIVVAAKSTKVSRMQENLHTADKTMQLSEEDMQQLHGLDKYQSYKTNPNPLASFIGGPDCFTKEGTDIFD